MNRHFAVVAGYAHGHLAVWFTTPAARHFRRVSPRLPRLSGVEGIDFLNHQTGWFLTYTTANATERIYRTRDGGRSWRWFTAPTHVEGGPAYDTIDFLTPHLGWLTDSEPTAPSNTLYVTRNAGATWHEVHRTDVPRNSKPGELPNFGPAQFTSASDGYDTGDFYTGGILPTYATSDGGKTWHRTNLQRGAHRVDRPLTISDGHPVVAVTRCDKHAHLRLFTHTSGATTWTGSPTLHAAPTNSECEVSISVPTASTAWVVISETHTATVARLDSSGHWHTTSPLIPSDAQDQAAIQSTDASHAWIIIHTPEQHYLLVTTNAGRTWRRAHLPSR